MEEQKLRQAIELLDHEVPREGAQVKFSQYGGGSDECQIVANRNGYLRLGIEFLKGAFPLADEDDDSTAADVDLKYLTSEDSTVRFDWFERREILGPESNSASATGKVIELLFLTLIAVVLVLAFIGAATVISWFTRA